MYVPCKKKKKKLAFWAHRRKLRPVLCSHLKDRVLCRSTGPKSDLNLAWADLIFWNTHFCIVTWPSNFSFFQQSFRRYDGGVKSNDSIYEQVPSISVPINYGLHFCFHIWVHRLRERPEHTRCQSTRIHALTPRVCSRSQLFYCAIPSCISQPRILGLGWSSRMHGKIGLPSDSTNSGRNEVTWSPLCPANLE